MRDAELVEQRLRLETDDSQTDSFAIPDRPRIKDLANGNRADHVHID